MADISSHWHEMLSTFRHESGGFSGLRGFGTVYPTYTRAWHLTMQRRFRPLGRRYPSFSRFAQAGRRVARRQKRALCLDMLRQIFTLAVCDAHGVIRPGGTYTVIGDGFGALASLILEAVPGARVALINLPQVLDVDRHYLTLAHPRHAATFIPAGGEMPSSLATFNVASMQEMNPDVIDDYFRMIRARSKFFYCCNRIEKRLPDGTVTRFHDYPWFGTVLLDELCPWHREFYSPIPPFWRPYDGPIQHRLIRNDGSTAGLDLA